MQSTLIVQILHFALLHWKKHIQPKDFENTTRHNIFFTLYDIQEKSHNQEINSLDNNWDWSKENSDIHHCFKSGNIPKTEGGHIHLNSMTA